LIGIKLNLPLAMFILNKQGFIGLIKEKIFKRKKNKDPSEDTKSHDHPNYVQQMLRILNKAQPFGIMTELQKARMVKLIFKNGGFPKEYRKQLWTLA